MNFTLLEEKRKINATWLEGERKWLSSDKTARMSDSSCHCARVTSNFQWFSSWCRLVPPRWIRLGDTVRVGRQFDRRPRCRRRCSRPLSEEEKDENFSTAHVLNHKEKKTGLHFFTDLLLFGDLNLPSKTLGFWVNLAFGLSLHFHKWNISTHTVPNSGVCFPEETGVNVKDHEEDINIIKHTVYREMSQLNQITRTLWQSNRTSGP